MYMDIPEHSLSREQSTGMQNHQGGGDHGQVIPEFGHSLCWHGGKCLGISMPPATTSPPFLLSPTPFLLWA